jgi:tensin
MGLLRISDESRPLVKQRSSPTSPTKRNYYYHYINAGIYDADGRFGDSCRQSLTSVNLETHQTMKNTIEFDFKKNLIRETNSATCSPKKFLLSTLKRTDSLNANNLDDEEDFELKEASWFQTSGLPHEISLEVLAQQNPGAFLVRKSTTKSGCFALSVRVPAPGPKVAHYLILKTSKGYKIKVIGIKY